MRKFVSLNQSNSILEKLNDDRGCNKTTCDIQLKCDDKIFHAHKNVLSMVSDYFKKLFYTEMKEKYQDTVAVNEIAAEVFQKVLDFVYSAEITIDSDNAVDLLNAANYLMIEDLIRFCCTFLIDSLDCSNSVKIWLNVKKFDIVKLNKACRRFVTKHFADLNDSDTINSMDQVTFKRFIAARPKSTTAEEKAFQFTVAWVKHDLEKRKHSFPELFELIEAKLISNQFLAYDMTHEEFILEFKCCTQRVFNAMKVLHGPHPGSSILFMNENSTILKMLDINFGFNKLLSNLDLSLQGAGFVMFKNYLYMIGGSSDLESRTDLVFKLDVRSPNKGWEKQPSMKFKRRNAGVAVIQNLMFVFGGYSVHVDPSRTYVVSEKLKLDDKENKWVKMKYCQRGSLDVISCKEVFYALHYENLSCEKYDPTTETSEIMYKLPRGSVKLVAMEDQLYVLRKLGRTLLLQYYNPKSGESHDVSKIIDVGEFRDACAAHGQIVVSYESTTKNKVVRVYAYNFEDEKWKFVIYSKDTSEYWKLIPYHTNPFE